MRKYIKILLVAVIALSALIIVGCKYDINGGVEMFSITAEDQEAVDGKIAVSYHIIEKHKEYYKSFSAAVYHGDNLICETELNPNTGAAVIDCSYGRLKVKLKGIGADGTALTLAEDSVSVWAEEYNVACMNATFPVVYFTLDMFSMGEEEVPGAFAANGSLPIMKDVPTFISLERVDAYSWDNLPDNVYALPNADEKTRMEGGFFKNNELMAEFIKELYEINSHSKFNFYCVDNYPELILQFFTAQGIPDESFKATMISDGTGTAVIYKKHFSAADSITEYEKMLAEWNRIKTAAADGKKNYLDDVYNRYHDQYSILATYAMVIASSEGNVDWWCSRDLFTGNTESEDIKKIIEVMKTEGSMKIFGINNMLSILHTEEQNALKELFHFDAEMFADSEKAGKKPLVIIGSSPTIENGELEGYIKLIKKLYGEEYMLYYKGHPGYPVEFDDSKNAIFEEHGIINLDASIAAELIMFYCPDIYLVGWGSTTFKSAADGKFLALFAYDEESGSAYAKEQGYPTAPAAFYKTETVGNKAYVTVWFSDSEEIKYFDVDAQNFVASIPSVK